MLQCRSLFIQACDHHDAVDCIRGSNIWFWRTVVQIIPFMFCFITICVSMYLLYKTVREQEQNMARHSRQFGVNEVKKSKLALRKATEYIAAFAAVWVPVLFTAFFFDLGVKLPFGLWLMDATMIPIQGFFNALVYSGILIHGFQKTISWIRRRWQWILRVFCSKASEDPPHSESLSMKFSTVGSQVESRPLPTEDMIKSEEERIQVPRIPMEASLEE